MSSIFLEFQLPNSPTWFYFSIFITIAFFLNFPRLLCQRNWDLLLLFIFVPGFLLLEQDEQLGGSTAYQLAGYIYLMSASGIWLIRCFLDLVSLKRPLITPNLSTPGLIWIGGALFTCLAVVVFTRTSAPTVPLGNPPAALTQIQEKTAEVVEKASTGEGGSPSSTTLFWVERSFTALCHLGVIAGLFFIGFRQFGDLQTGVSASVLYLLLPYTAFNIDQVHHVWPAALLVWAIYCFRRPAIAGIFVGLAAGTTFFPVFLIPVWIQFYWRRGSLMFWMSTAIMGLLGLTLTLLLSRLSSDVEQSPLLWNYASWLPWKMPDTQSIWQGAHWAYRLPVCISFIILVGVSVIWPTARNLGQLIAMQATIIIGVQFWYADQGGVYVLWYLPLLILMILRPNCSDLYPMPRLPRTKSQTGSVHDSAPNTTVVPKIMTL